MLSIIAGPQGTASKEEIEEKSEPLKVASRRQMVQAPYATDDVRLFLCRLSILIPYV